MREPGFWHRSSSWQSVMLAPLAYLYGVIAAARMSKAGAHAALPAICVGNYHVGGAGKTPTVLAIVEILRAKGERPCVLTRGYGGRERGPLRVDPEQHRASDVGDEPLMMALHTPVIVSRDRVAGAALATSSGFSVIVMDDGFQNPSLAKDANLIVIDARRGIGNGCVFPAGPLRAPLGVQVTRTDALIVIGEGRAADAVVRDIGAQGKLIVRARISPVQSAVARLAGQRVLAFAGIGDPDRFFATLKFANVDVVRSVTFADHHAYTEQEIATLIVDAKRDNLRLVTTEKDMSRLRGFANFQAIDVLPIRLAFEDSTSLEALIDQRIAAVRRR